MPYPGDPYILEQLVPLLQDTVDGTNVLYNPWTFLGEYGEYLTAYDPTQEKIAKEQGALMHDTIISQNINDLRTMENVSGATGIRSGALNTQINQTFDKIINDLLLGDMQSLDAQKHALKSYQQDLMSEMGTLAILGAFDPSDDDSYQNYILQPIDVDDVGSYAAMLSNYWEYVDPSLWEDWVPPEGWDD